ncbi:winged helix-turn-helix domain-containing protein [Streptomyces sp. NPDC001165]|uniref:winged helix-turn-helix domain-containing protein n=1 Tax=Streptomyces sp. NPDC001165 TaxID=3364546 RepID=UPI0036953A70
MSTRPPSQHERVVQELLDRIGDGAYPPGSLLPPQRVLAEDFDVSRDTVQRALRELRDMGYVDARQGSGVRVILRPGRNGDRAARRPPALRWVRTWPTLSPPCT